MQNKKSAKKEKIKNILAYDFDVEEEIKSDNFKVQQYIKALEKQISKISDKYFEIKAENVTLKRLVSDFEKRPKGNIIIRHNHDSEPKNDNG